MRSDLPLIPPRPADSLDADGPPAFGVRQLVGAARLHWWIPVSSLLVGLGAGTWLQARPIWHLHGTVLGTVLCGVAVMGGVLGLLLRERYDQTIRRFAELGFVLRLPGLAIIPPLAPGFAYRDDATGVGHDVFRTLRARVLESGGAAPPRCVMVTGAVVDHGATTTAANLAMALAHPARRVLLIDCEMRWPRLHARFGLADTPGLSELLADRADLQDAFRMTSLRNLYLLPAGTPPTDPASLLTGDRFGILLASLSMLFDLVILDAPPVLTAAESSVLAAMSDAVVLVVRAGQTDRYAAQEAMRRLGAAHANVIGVAMNDPDQIAARYEPTPTASSAARQAGSAPRRSAA